MRKNKKGFTLIELLAVVIILGVITTIVLVSFSNEINKSKKLYYKTQADLLVISAKQYFSSNIRLLPREIGSTKEISVQELINLDYTKPLNDYKKKSCSTQDLEATKILVTKIGDNNYNYNINFICNNYEQLTDKTSPSIAFIPKTEVKDKFIPIKVIIKDSSDLSSINYIIKSDLKEQTYTVSTSKKTFEIPLNEEGIYQIIVKAIDINGNVSEAVSPKYTIDKTPTIMPILSNPIKEYTKSNIDINVLSAVDAVKTECATQTNTIITNYVSCDKKFTVTNNTIVLARSYDKAGNVSDIARLEVENIDKIMPNVEFQVNSSSAQLYNIKINASDNLSGIKQFRYRLSKDNGRNFGNWSNYISAVTTNVELFEIGANKIQVEVYDNALNVNTITSNVYLIKEITMPIINISPSEMTNGNVVVTINYDLTSTQMLWSYDNVNWNNYTSPITITENKTIHAKAVRGAFSSDVVKRNIINIDKTSPTITLKNIEVSIYQNDYYNLVDLIANKSDNLTSSGNLNVKINPSATNTLPVGNHNVTFTVRDEAGNVSSVVKTITIRARQQTQYRYRNYVPSNCCSGGYKKCNCHSVPDYCTQDYECCDRTPKYCRQAVDCDCSYVSGDCPPRQTSCPKEYHCRTCYESVECGETKTCSICSKEVRCGSSEECDSCYDSCLTTYDCSYWSEWSAWSTTNPGVGTGTKQVETRIVNL